MLEIDEEKFEEFKEELRRGGGYECSIDYIIRRSYEAGLSAAQHGMHVDSAIAIDSHIGLLVDVEIGDDVVPIPPSQ